MDPIEQFKQERTERIKKQGQDKEIEATTSNFNVQSSWHKYTYNFTWMGRPIIQFPQDMVAMQELIWKIQPDLLIETGIAHGGSIICYASYMELIGKGEVLGIDIDIRAHNRKEIEAHPMFKRIQLFEGSSIAEETLAKVEEYAKDKKTIMVCLDSSHTHEHVLQELKLYSKFVTEGSYLIVFDTLIEQVPDPLSQDRPWGKGDNPETAVREFLKENDQFARDTEIDNKLLISMAPGGYLKKIK